MASVDADKSLPRSLDVQISVSRPGVETRTDLSTLVVALQGLGFPADNRVKFYSTIEAVEADFAAGTEAVFAASAFFSQNPRSSTLAIGDVVLLVTPEDSTGIKDALTSIANSATNQGKYLYGWALGETLRDTAAQIAAAEWVLPRIAMMVLVNNDSDAYNPTQTDDIGPVIKATDNRRVVCMYHNNSQRYPDVSILAYMLHVNYRLKDATVTAKFKQLPGIETVSLTETDWIVLQDKGYNTYTAIGNDARTYRDGNTSGIAGWWMDTVINLDNFVEDLSLNVYNVFLRNKKIPFTRSGQLLIVDACNDTGNQYVFNGTFADREVSDITSKSGVMLVLAVQIILTPISQSTPADRAARIGPPIAMIVQETGAIHSVAINVGIAQ